MVSNNETDQLMRDATAVIEKQHRTIAALTQQVANLEALVEQSPRIVKAIAGDPGLVMKTVDLLLAEGATGKDVAAHQVPDATTEQRKAGGGGRIFTRHGGNVLPALRA